MATPSLEEKEENKCSSEDGGKGNYAEDYWDKWPTPSPEEREENS